MKGDTFSHWQGSGEEKQSQVICVLIVSVSVFSVLLPLIGLPFAVHRQVYLSSSKRDKA